MSKLSKTHLSKIQKDLIECENNVDNISKFTKRMLFILYLFVIAKVVIFYIDYIIMGINWDVIFSKNAGFLILFFGAPIAYLTIPLIAWHFYGKWIWTGMAYNKLREESETFLKEERIAENDGVGILNNCINIRKERPIAIDTLFVNLNKIWDSKSKDTQQNIPGIGIKITAAKGNSWVIHEKHSKYYIDFYGLLTDSEVLQVVDSQHVIGAQQLLLLICMSTQIIQSQSQSINGVNYDPEYQSILDEIKVLN